ncbi:hypothetical protein [Actinoplanes sp. NPDC049802]|uniref:hypothetical protein n=1 Tax=Actinoplanes sp. NPDC049802 TaxID=3154742 RepID=UPI0033ECFF44
MSTRVTAVSLMTLALLAGCTPDEKGATEAPIGPAPSVTASPVAPEKLPEAEDPTGTLAAVGDGGDWDNYVTACADAEQEAIVQNVAVGDVNGDNTADALVARTCDASTSYFPSTIEVFDGKSPVEKPTRIGKPILTDVGPTDQPWVIGLTVKGGAVTIKAYGTDSTDSNACPKLRLSYRYKLQGADFVRTDRAADKSASCLTIE